MMHKVSVSVSGIDTFLNQDRSPYRHYFLEPLSVPVCRFFSQYRPQPCCQGSRNPPSQPRELQKSMKLQIDQKLLSLIRQTVESHPKMAREYVGNIYNRRLGGRRVRLTEWALANLASDRQMLSRLPLSSYPMIVTLSPPITVYCLLSMNVVLMEVVLDGGCIRWRLNGQVYATKLLISSP